MLLTFVGSILELVRGMKIFQKKTQRFKEYNKIINLQDLCECRDIAILIYFIYLLILCFNYPQKSSLFHYTAFGVQWVVFKSHHSFIIQHSVCNELCSRVITLSLYSIRCAMSCVKESSLFHYTAFGVQWVVFKSHHSFIIQHSVCNELC